MKTASTKLAAQKWSAGKLYSPIQKSWQFEQRKPALYGAIVTVYVEQCYKYTALGAVQDSLELHLHCYKYSLDGI